MDNDPLLTKWADLPIKKHLRISEVYIIFINNNDEFDWKYENPTDVSKGYNEKEYNRLYNYLSEIEIQDININNQSIKRRFKELIANALVNLFECDYENAEKGLSTAKDYITRKNYETTRIWSLVTTSIITIIFFAIGIVGISLYKTDDIIKILFSSFFGSSSILMFSFIGINKTNISIESGFWFVVSESAIRVLVGIFIGFIGILLIKYRFILPQIIDSSIMNYEIPIAILISPCEKLIPKVIGRLDNEMFKEDK